MTVFKGDTVEAAIEAGLKALSLTRTEIETTVQVTPRRGFFGIGARQAEVDVTAKQTETTHSDVQATAAAATEPQAQPMNRTTTETTTEETTETEASTIEFETEATSKKSYAEVVAELKDYLDEIVAQLGIDATSTTEIKHRQVTVNFNTEAEGLLIGKHGRTINAMQSLAQVYLNHKRFSKLVVTLDVANYRSRRIDTLTRLAENMAREVVATGKPVYLDPMPSFERKQIHAVLANNDHVMTYSAGSEPKRAVVISPR
ncbi:RNA-binding cell elongation regulator Jag/EloR [Secundilactobacillus paracollinoides]|uniref:RNA-binding cell elongation regulator Jag/EloR n=1 Tax=Secundilactobacillus paracollinoides TaxID=240427 RepID=UPI0006D28716|nr:RNA-binding cell elongation regulator Jag/EloR [Secundilactobacillus paracollinoides]